MAHVGLLEDNARIARLSATMLQFAGHTVTLYDRGRTFLDTLCSLRFDLAPLAGPALPLDALILDLQLPDMAGIEVVQYLQSCPATRSLPIILCTAASASEVMQVRHVAPGIQVVEKPFRLQALTDAVRDVLTNSETSKLVEIAERR